MSYIGDFNVNQTVYLPFPSTNANGTPTALANGTVVVYKNTNLAEATANITLNTSLDSRAGFNVVSINMALNSTFFVSGNDFIAVLSVGDVSSTSVANMTLGSWSVNNRAGTTIPQLSAVGGQQPMIRLNVPYTHARVTPPLGSATVLSSLVSASPTNVTLSANTTSLWLQAENGTIRFEIDGSNASASSRFLSPGQNILFEKKNMSSDWFSSINVTQDPANSVNGTLRVDASNG